LRSARASAVTLSASEQPLGHEVDAAEHDDAGGHARPLARQLERVADEVGHFEDLRALVVVGQHDGVAGALEVLDLGHQGRECGARTRAVGVRVERAQSPVQVVGGGRGAVHGSIPLSV
jgi:hypothetical protein